MNVRIATAQEIEATYGYSQTPCIVFCYKGWYAIKGSMNVNRCDPTLLVDGVDVETLMDTDVFSWQSGIESLDQLIEAVEN